MGVIASELLKGLYTGIPSFVTSGIWWGFIWLMVIIKAVLCDICAAIIPTEVPLELFSGVELMTPVHSEEADSGVS